MFNRIFVHWQTTTQAVLSAVVGLSAVAPSISWLTPKQAASLVSAGVIGKVILGGFQKDAGKLIADVPGQGERVVAGHPVPNDPKNTPTPQQ